MKFADCHMHSLHSFDADKNASVKSIISAAEKKDIFFIAITDHFDINNKYDGVDPVYEPMAPYL